MKVKEFLAVFKNSVWLCFEYEINSKFCRSIGECNLNSELVKMLGDKEISYVDMADNSKKLYIFLKEDKNG